MMTSCLKDEDNDKGVTYSDTAITSFSIATLKQVRDTVSKSGADSSYIANIKGNKFYFSIDQTKGLIYNTDSLPYGTKVNRVLVSMTAHNSGTILWKSQTSDSLKYYSSNDSVDLSQPRTLRVYSNDGSSYRTYTVSVNIHKQKADVFNWLAPVENTELGQLTASRMLAFGGNIYLLGQKDGKTIVYATSENNPSAWVASPASFGAEAYKSGIVAGDYIYLADEGTVNRTIDGINWKPMGTDSRIRQLVAGGKTKLFAISNDGGLLMSEDQGITWNSETIDDATSLLPTDNFGYSCQSLTTNREMERIMLVGTTAAQSNAVVWTKLVDTSDASASYPWTLVDAATSQAYGLPALTSLSLLNYDGSVIAMGQAAGTFTTPLISADGGITWKSRKHYTYPSGLGVAANFSATVDRQNFIWLLSGTQLWRGRLNRMGWDMPLKEIGG